MVILWIFTFFVVINFTWAKIIPVNPPTKQFGKRIDNNNILQLYPNWQPIQSDPAKTQQNHFQPLDLRSQTQSQPLSILGIPQAHGLKIPQIEIYKTPTQDQTQKLETQLPLSLPLEVDLPTSEQTTQNIEIESKKPQTGAFQRYPLSSSQYYQVNPYQDSRLLTSQNKPTYYQPLPQNTPKQTEQINTQLPLRLPLETELPTSEQTTQNLEIQSQKPQTEALQGYPLSGKQYYQLNPYQDSRLLTTQTKPTYFQPLAQNKPTYYQAPNILSNSVDLRLLANPNLNYQNLNIPSQTLTVPKESLWNPTNSPEVLYTGQSLEDKENINDSNENLKTLTPVRTVPKHYKFEKTKTKSKQSNENQENIHDSSEHLTSKLKSVSPARTVPKHYKFEKTNTKAKQTKPKEKLKNKEKHNKNNIKLSSDHVSDIVKEPKGVQNSNDWVPISRTVPKHYTFEKNSLENKEKPKNKKKLKGEPVEKLNNPKHYIFEQGSLVKKFKQNNYLEREPLDGEAFEEPKRASKKPKKNKEKVKPVHELLDEPSTELDENEKESVVFENQAPVKEKPKHKKLPSNEQENLGSDPYYNHKGVNDFENDNFSEFNGGANAIKAHHGDASQPPASKDRIQFHMVGHDGPMSYKWGFDTGAGNHRQYRFEERDKEGIVKGQFGYLDDKGKFRKMNYNAHPVHGFSMEPADGTFDDLKA